MRTYIHIHHGTLDPFAVTRMDTRCPTQERVTTHICAKTSHTTNMQSRTRHDTNMHKYAT